MRDLKKWPRLLVSGERVSPELADEIIVRTTQWWLSCNDRAWLDAVYALVGIEVGEYGLPSHANLRRVETELNVINLSYLHNDRVASSWIGGPRGWCDWDGTVGCSEFNVGKWPSVDALTADWTAIAEAFPTLNLVAQVVPDEGAADRPAAQWRVVEGLVAVDDDPAELIVRPTEPDYSRWVGSLRTPGRERGVSLERLEAALDRVRGVRS